MRKVWITAAAVLASAGLVAGCGNSERSGSPGVYAEIAASTDCAELEATFNRASDNHDAATNRGDMAEMDWTTGYMDASYDRMDEIGCFD
jgi:hypothetical protein